VSSADAEICGVQFDVAWEDQPANCRRIEQMLESWRPAPGALVVLPEMCTTGFTMDPAAGEATSDTLRCLGGLARRHEVHLVAGLARRRPDANEAVVFGPDGAEILRYRKQRPFTLGGEDEVYAGGEGFGVFHWGGFQVAPFICYDLRFPELFRLAVAAGADLLVVIASWPARRVVHWMKLLQARAIENQCHVIGVNRTGDDPINHHCGRSLIVDPMGEILVDGGGGERMIRATVSVEAQRELRERLPFLDDMRLKTRNKE
jgi:omega-amidase